MRADEDCLVIGANGFVGSHLVDELAEAGYHVRAFDRFSRQPSFHKSDRVEVIPGSIFDDKALKKALKGSSYVFHSFSATTPFISDSDPYMDITLNLMRNVQLFEEAVAQGVKKMMFISSGGSVYGSIAEHKKVKETDAPLPISPYGIGKLAAEYYLAYFHRKHDLKYISYRLTNPYGPRQLTHKNQGVIPTFIEKMKNGEELEVFGDGTASRDFIYIRDATKMIVDTFIRETKHHTYNIGSGRQIKLNQIIKSLEKTLGTKAKVSYKEAPKTFLLKPQVSIRQYIDEFGRAPATTLLQGLQQTIASF